MFDHTQESIEFRRIVQRSEEHRALVMIGALLFLTSIAVIRDLAGGAPMPGRTFVLILCVIGAVALVELATIAAARRADRRGALVETRVWYGTTVVEALAPTAVILITQLTSRLGPVVSLTAPAILIYVLVCALAILRLRPMLCLLAGLIGAAGHASLVAFAWWWTVQESATGPAAPAGTELNPAYHFAFAANILLAGVVCALAAGEVRRWVLTSLREHTARRRLEVVARNTLIFGLAKLAEYRDSDTGAHLERISAYCQLLCVPLRERYPEINGGWVDQLTLASSMHDIGKVGIPDAVLLKPGRLDDAERSVIERHPDLGYRALDAILRRAGGDRLLEMSADIAACHHERWDGKGYPNGLAGDRIPLAARIVAVADVYDALTSERVYKPALPHEKAAQILREGAGTQFDPEVVAAFDRMESSFRKVMDRYASAPVANGGMIASPPSVSSR